MQNGGCMFQFTVFPNGGSLAVTFYCICGDSERRDCTLSEQLAKFLANIHQLGQVFDVLARTRILDHRHSRGSPGGWLDRAAHLRTRLFHKGCDFPDLSFHNCSGQPLCPLCPLWLTKFFTTEGTEAHRGIS